MSNGTSSALNSEQDLASIPMAQGGLCPHPDRRAAATSGRKDDFGAPDMLARSWRGIVATHLAREGCMTVTIGRRELLVALGGAAATWPLAARAQQGERVRRIGLLMGVADDREGQARVTALRQGLQELGWTDGNIPNATRFGGGDAGRIRSHAAELVALAPDLVIGNTTPVIRALRQATSFIPIVMAGVNDPVEQGFVSSLAHPGGNITGFSFVDFQMVGK